MSRLRLIVVITLIVLVGIFALQNIVAVEVRFLFWGFSLPRAVLIFLLLVVGAVIGWFLRGFMRRGKGH